MNRQSILVLCICSLTACQDDSDTCSEERAYIAAHQRCAQHADCVLVGACTGGFGIQAVELSAQSRAQSYSDRTACEIIADAQLVEAMCQQGRCTAVPTGHYCGERVDASHVPGPP